MSTTNKAGRPRQQTSIPFGLNRYVLIGIACLACVFNGPIVFNWPPLREAMIKSGAFAWKCGGFFDEDGLCVDQRIALSTCGTLGQSMMFVGSVFAGAFVDQFGPRLCSLVGAAVFALSYLFLAISSEKIPLYYAAWTLNGLAVEFCFMGLLTIPYLFPSKPKVAMALMGTFRSLSMLYSIGINYAVKPGFALVKTAWICFALAIFWGVVMFALLPNKKFLWILKCETEAEQAKVDTDLEEHRSSLSYEEGEEAEAAAPKGTWKDFVNRAMTFTYLAWLLVFALSYTRGSFYGVSLSDQTPELTTAFSWASPLSFIPCPFLGYAADYFGMMPVLFFLNACGTIMFICLLFPRVIGLQWIAVLLSAVLLSFLASQNYCWIAEAYRENVQGKLAGLAMCVAGLVSLVNTPLNSWGTRHNNYLPLNIVFLCISVANFLLLTFMWLNRHTTKGDVEDKPRKGSVQSELATTEKQANLDDNKLPSQSYSSHHTL